MRTYNHLYVYKTTNSESQRKARTVTEAIIRGSPRRVESAADAEKYGACRRCDCIAVHHAILGVGP
ncbi:MAG: hypothetical protein ACYTF1_00150 [Planctomycetota bacterium]